MDIDVLISNVKPTGQLFGENMIKLSNSQVQVISTITNNKLEKIEGKKTMTKKYLISRVFVLKFAIRKENTEIEIKIGF